MDAVFVDVVLYIVCFIFSPSLRVMYTSRKCWGVISSPWLHLVLFSRITVLVELRYMSGYDFLTFLESGAVTCFSLGPLLLFPFVIYALKS